MSAQKINMVEMSPNNEAVEPEKLDINVINKYQELNVKCDVVITKIKNRKLKSKK